MLLQKSSFTLTAELGNYSIMTLGHKKFCHGKFGLMEILSLKDKKEI